MGEGHLSEIIEITKTGYMWILTKKGISMYKRANGKTCSKRSYAASARTEPGGAGKVKRHDRAEDYRPTPTPRVDEVEGIFTLSDTLKWKKDKGTGHIGVDGITVGSP